MGRDFHTRNLGNNPIRCDDMTRVVAVYPGDAVSNHRKCERQVGGGFDEPDPTLQIKRNNRFLQSRFIWTVNQVKPVGFVPQFPLDAINSRIHTVRLQPRGTEETKQAAPRHLNDNFLGSNAVGHGSGYIGKPNPMILAKARIPQLLDPHSGRMSCNPEGTGTWIPISQNTKPSFGDSDLAPEIDERHRPSNTPDRLPDPGRLRTGRRAVRTPKTERRRCLC